MTEREVLKLALEALKNAIHPWEKEPAIAAIKEALAQPEPSELDVWKSRALQAEAVIEKFMAQPKQEPVAWRYRMPVEDGHWVWNYATYIDDPKYRRCEPLYTTPPQPEREPVCGATLAGMHATIRHLSALVDEQRKLMVEVDDVFGRDAYGLKFEDGDSELIDRVRTHIEAISEPKNQEPEPVIDKSAAVRIATSLGWEPKRKPLSEERIDDIWNLHCDEMGYVSVSDAVELARDFEAAHGIKE